LTVSTFGADDGVGPDGIEMTGVWAVLVAAGRGDRLDADRPKAFAKLAGRPLVAEPLERLEASEWVETIVVVAPPDWEEPVILLAEELGAGKVGACVSGGETRADSVRAGMAEVPEEATVVLVHDAARPLLPPEVIERVLAPLGEGWDGAVPALPVADTLKRAAPDGTVAETVARDRLYRVQTPQAFVAPTLRRALAVSLVDATDCAGFVEAGGGRVRIVEGDLRLTKVTTAADLAFVEGLLAGRA
jgi:2-C-methyl-D-erythritol 4-phosphate cytidylyltransferase